MQQVNEGLHDSFSKVYREEGYAYELLNARLFRNLTQKELSRRTGISPEEISRIEGGRRNPTVKMLKRLAEGLDMELCILLIPESADHCQTEAADQ
ncbi:MAG: helix-turn-helix transcriptional regulator [Solobacterium sp.]|nr:helix-turn-helix transcriptional regulator [Solobacterium sp.]